MYLHFHVCETCNSVTVHTWKGGGVETAGRTVAAAAVAVVCSGCCMARGLIRCSTVCTFPSSISLPAGAALNTGYCPPRVGNATARRKNTRMRAWITEWSSADNRVEQKIVNMFVFTIYETIAWDKHIHAPMKTGIPRSESNLWKEWGKLRKEVRERLKDAI